MDDVATGSRATAGPIVDRPEYAFSKPVAFEEEAAPTGEAVFDVRSYGAVEGASIDNRPAIQAALNAASAAGGGIVYIPPGTYGITGRPDHEGCLQVASNVFLKGGGMGETTLRLMDGSTADVHGLVRTQPGIETSNWGIADLTLDGNDAATDGKVIGFYCGPRPGDTLADRDVTLLRVEAKSMSGYGFDPHEQTIRLTIKDCVSHDNGLDGFALDFVRDSEITGNIAYNNARHGFNLCTTANNVYLEANAAYGNGGAGLVAQRGSEDIPAPSNIVIANCTFMDNAREGILIHMATDVTIIDSDVHSNSRAGIKLLGASNVTITQSEVSGNSLSKAQGYSEIAIAEYVDPDHARTYEARSNLISGNTIGGGDALKSRYGIEEGTGETGNTISLDNVFEKTTRGELALAGSGSSSKFAGTTAADTIKGTNIADYIDAGAGNDTITGGNGADTILGGAGGDTIDGGDGSDALDGGAGNDTYTINSAGDTVTEANADIQTGGTDTLLSTLSCALAANVEILRLLGTAVSGTGNSGANKIFGNDATNLLDGQEGADTLCGGNGNDSYHADAAGDVIIEATALVTAGGLDTVFASLNWTLGANLECLTLTGRAIVANGNGLANTITGNADANSISGHLGADTLMGEGGNDTITGGAGADILKGGAGADRFKFNALAESGKTSATRDVIKDFTHSDTLALSDRIDVSAIDANGSAAGNGTFQFLAERGAAFTGVKGQLHWYRIDSALNDKTILEGDLNGDKIADFQIEITGLKTLKAVDFIL